MSIKQTVTILLAGLAGTAGVATVASGQESTPAPEAPAQTQPAPGSAPPPPDRDCPKEDGAGARGGALDEAPTQDGTVAPPADAAQTPV